VIISALGVSPRGGGRGPRARAGVSADVGDPDLLTAVLTPCSPRARARAHTRPARREVESVESMQAHVREAFSGAQRLEIAAKRFGNSLRAETPRPLSPSGAAPLLSRIGVGQM
jgi:hypothetical protein